MIANTAIAKRILFLLDHWRFEYYLSSTSHSGQFMPRVPPPTECGRRRGAVEFPRRYSGDQRKIDKILHPAHRAVITGKNGWHGMTGQFRQSVFGRLGGYEDVNDAERLGRDPTMRWIVGGKAIGRQAASTSQMGRFETELLANDANIEALADMNGVWIDKVQ